MQGDQQRQRSSAAQCIEKQKDHRHRRQLPGSEEGGNEGNLTRSRLCASSPMSWVIIRTSSDIGSASAPARPGSKQISYALLSVRASSSRTHHQSEPSHGGVKCRAPSGNVSPPACHLVSSLLWRGARDETTGQIWSPANIKGLVYRVSVWQPPHANS